jgi:lipopolysaccharide export system protein LptA
VLTAAVSWPLFPAPDGEQEQKEDLILEHAERMNRRIEDGVVVLHLYGGVSWKRGETLITSDTAVYREEVGWLRLLGDVSIREEEKTITADTVDYYEDDDRAVATGLVTVVSDEGRQEMVTDRLVYFRTDERSIAYDRPLITIVTEEEEEDGVTDTTVTRIRGDTVETTGEDSLFITGDVTVSGDSLDAHCDSAFYDQAAEWIRLRKSPTVTVGEYTAWGAEIDLYAPDDKLTYAVVRHHAEATGRKEVEEEEGEVEERYHTWADSLVLTFRDEELRSLAAYSGARSLVEREDEEKKVEKNYVTGRKILVHIDEGKVERVVVEGEGKGVFVLPPDSTGRTPDDG